MNSPLVSIIVPCYNQAEYLSDALDSVLSQTYVNWECVIVNDGSSDNSEQTALYYCSKDKRFKYIKQNNQGLAQTRNNGIKESKGTFILPLDADDKIGESYIEIAVTRFIEHPETTLVYCKAELFGTINQPWELPEYNYYSMIWGNSIFCTAMYKRCDYDKTIGYNPNMKYGYEDWDFWLSLLNENSIVYQINKVLFFYRKKNTSMATTITSSKKEESYKTLIKNHEKIYLQNLYKIIEYKDNYEKMIKEAQLSSIIMSSDEYKIGSMITKRFKHIGNLIIKIGNCRSKKRITL